MNHKDTLSDYLVVCRKCEVEYHILANEEGMKKWKAGRLIQNVLPDLSANERELFISQTCGNCWDKIYPQDSLL
jgi:pyruvoyl-dependent arginine decarboxylase (PvlArgDC)